MITPGTDGQKVDENEPIISLKGIYPTNRYLSKSNNPLGDMHS